MRPARSDKSAGFGATGLAFSFNDSLREPISTETARAAHGTCSSCFLRSGLKPLLSSYCNCPNLDGAKPDPVTAWPSPATSARATPAQDCCTTPGPNNATHRPGCAAREMAGQQQGPQSPALGGG